MQAVQPSLAPPVQKYLEALELELKQQPGVAVDEALSDAREYLQNTFDALDRAEPGLSDESIFDHFVERFGRPADIAKAYGSDANPFLKLPAYAPGWRIYCTSCGRSAPAAQAGITRVGAFSRYKITLGYCRDCRWLRFFRLAKDLQKPKLTAALGVEKSPAQVRGFLGNSRLQNWLVALTVGLAAIIVGFIAYAVFFAVPKPQTLPKVFQNMPEGWTVRKSDVIPDQQRKAVEGRLGLKMDKLTNTFISHNEQSLQINTIECSSVADARKFESILRKGKSLRQLVQRKEKTVYEIVARRGSELKMALVARYELGIQPKEVRYKVKFEAAPLKTGDCMQWNKLFNLFLKSQSQPSAELDQQIGAIAKDFEFGSELILANYGIGEKKTKHGFSQQPIETQTVAGGSLSEFHFEKMKNRSGIDYVEVELEVTSKTKGVTPETRKGGALNHLTQPTDRWPVDDPEIKSLAKEIVGSATTEKEKVTAILQWIVPGKNVRFAGDVTGSRYGVEKFLDQKFGHCWDFTDAFVTLSRASGVPTRQVFGWLHQSSGHVWAEVLFSGEGWKHVDPTSAMACGSDYVPITLTENGEIPLLYTSAVKIEVQTTSP